MWRIPQSYYPRGQKTCVTLEVTPKEILMLRAYRYFTFIPSVLAGGLLSGFWMPSAIAQAPVSAPQIRAHFTPYALQRLSRDLNSPSNAEDFFRVGREQFEQEIQQLTDPRSHLTEDVLKVSPTIRLPQDSFPSGNLDRGDGSDLSAS